MAEHSEGSTKAILYDLITLQWGNQIVIAVKARMRERTNAATLITDINACEAALRQKFPTANWIFSSRPIRSRVEEKKCFCHTFTPAARA